jgi:hypothetical protein
MSTEFNNLKMKLCLCITNEEEQMKTKMAIGIFLSRTDKVSRYKRISTIFEFLEFAYGPKLFFEAEA